MIKRIIKKYGKSKQFYFWLCSYMVILVLSIAVNSIGYFATIHFLKLEVEKSNKRSISNISTVCDNRFNEAVTSMYSLMRTSSVILMGREEYADNPFNALNVIHDIQTGLTSHGEISNCSVIFRKQDICINSDLGKSSIERIYSAYFHQWYNSADEWCDMVFSVSGAKYVTLTSNEEKSLFIIYRLYNISSDVAVMAKIDTNRITQFLQNDEGEISFITDKDGNILIAADNDILPKQIQLDNTDKEQLKIGGKDYFVSYQDSQSTPFRYVRLVESDIYLKSIKNVRTAFIFSYIFCVILAGGVAFGFSVMNEKNKRKLDVKLEKQSEYIRIDRLRQALEGKYELSAQELADEYKFVGHSFVVMLFDFLLTGSEHEKRIPNYRLICEYITSRFPKDISQRGICFCNINEMCIGVLSIKEDTDLQELRNMAVVVCNSLNANMGLETRCAISQITGRTDRLNECYNQVIEISNWWLLGEEEIVFLYDEAVQKYPAYSYGTEIRKDLTAYLISGDIKKVRQITKDAFEHYGQKSTLTMQRILVLEMVTTILQAAAQSGGEEAVSVRELYRDCMRIADLRQLNAAKETINKYMEELCKFNLGQIMDKRNMLKCREIAEYIKKNYMDCSLNVNMLSEIFNISRSWISKNFKEEMGISPSEYIVKCRIDKAKELLKTDKTVAAIAAEVGFCNERIYCRTFKKCENITSQRYRQMLNEMTDEEG